MRTTLVDADGNPRYTNRLADESSPYLAQHAHNPVDWYPWGEDAFARAREEDKPVFLSIGYSTCHWCHVMEVESFDNEEIADFLNRHFVSIKLDREQRPDLDDIYMTGVQMLTGQGGWPMSNFLTPDGKPFFAGTYYPPQNFMALLRQIATVWRERRDDVEKQAEEISEGIRRFTAARGEAQELGDNLCERATSELLGRFDSANGGFGGAPKFPNESMLLVALEDWRRNDNHAAFEALELSLDRMYQGGIYDQICGGFHRYAVDAVWLVPHFEKMLYNQAQLVRVYSRAGVLAGKDAWRRVAEQTVDYVLRDMRGADGTFFSATDADSEGEEGRFFVWTPDQLQAVLDSGDYALAVSLFGVTQEGNFEGANILHLSDSLEAFAQQRGEDLPALLARVRGINQRLYEAREQREHPLRDEKIITAWNGMMITALARAGFDLGRDDYVAAGETAARVLWQRVFDREQGELWRILYDDEVSIPGNLEDYACLAEAFLALYAVTGEREWLERGRVVATAMIERFYDEAAGGFFLARSSDAGPMITRPKSPMDGATPSGNSVAVSALVQLHAMTGDVTLEDKIVGTLNGLAGLLHASPSAFSYLIVGVEPYLAGAIGPIRFAGEGNVRIAVRPGQIHLDIAEGWHVNADEAENAALVPTRVDVEGQGVVDYPPGSNHRFEGRTDIRIEGDADALDITLQPCNESVCLPPETHHFDFR